MLRPRGRSGASLPEQFHVTREHGTERAFSHLTLQRGAEGTYRCVCCGRPFSAPTRNTIQAPVGRASTPLLSRKRSARRRTARCSCAALRSVAPNARLISAMSSRMGPSPPVRAIASMARRWNSILTSRAARAAHSHSSMSGKPRRARLLAPLADRDLGPSRHRAGGRLCVAARREVAGGHARPGRA